MYYTETEPQTLPIRKWDAWSKWVLFLLVGFSLTGRSFAYLGIPPRQTVHWRPDAGSIHFPAPAQVVRSLAQGADEWWSPRSGLLDAVDIDLLRDLRSDPWDPAGFFTAYCHRESGLQCLSALPVPRDLGGYSPAGTAP